MQLEAYRRTSVLDVNTGVQFDHAWVDAGVSALLNGGKHFIIAS